MKSPQIVIKGGAGIASIVVSVPPGQWRRVMETLRFIAPEIEDLDSALVLDESLTRHSRQKQGVRDAGSN